jgi:two-component system cell cycle sensor histidine kinase/response regulator CckA
MLRRSRRRSVRCCPDPVRGPDRVQVSAVTSNNGEAKGEKMQVVSSQPAPAPVKSQPFPKSDSKRIRVLVVDDEEPIRRFVERVLTDAGYETIVAADGAEAIKRVEKQGGLDLLVTDLMMPEMSGDELARRLRQTDRDLKVLYLTGFADQLFKEKVTLWHGEAFLEKPCSVKGLREAVALLFFGQLEAPPAP